MANPTLVIRVAANLAELKKNLKEGKDQIEVTSAAMTKLSNSFQGEKLIQAAHNTTAAIQKVGVATLNTSEGARSLTLLDKAMDKLLRTGQQVPPEMMKTAAELRRMGRATEEADIAVGRITKNYQQFDGILQSLGINIGPYVKGLEDVMALAAGGAVKLGLLASAAAVVGVALASWKIGEHAGEMYGWTEAIARGTAAARGYGDVAQQTALANADAADAVGHHDAMLKLQAKSVADSQAATAAQTEELQRNWSVTDGNADAFANLQRQLDAAAKKRKDDAIATFQASQAQSIFGEETKKTTTALIEQNAALDARVDQLKEVAAAEAARQAAVSSFMNAPTANGGGTEFSANIAPLTKTQLTEMGTKPGQAFSIETLREKLAMLENREGTIKPTNNKEFFALQREMMLLAQLRMFFQGIGRPETLEGLAGGTSDWRGGPALVGERGPEIVNLPRGAEVIPNHAIGGNVTIAPQLHFHGTVIGSSLEFQNAVTGALLNVYKVAGIPLPAGVG